MSARAEASERLSGEIVESLTAGLLVVGSEGKLRILNPAGRRMLNLPESAVPQDYREALREFEPLARAIEECLSTGRPIVRRTLEISFSGSTTHLGVSVSALTDGQGQRHGVICLFTDLTPVIEMEEQLRLKDSLARVGELTAGIAHEFRNGLATIHGYARLLDLNALPGSYRPHVEGIRQETDSLGRGRHEFPEFRQAHAGVAVARGPARDRGAGGRRSAARSACARRHRHRAGHVSRHRRRRRAVEAGVQQPASKRRGGVRRRVGDAARRHRRASRGRLQVRVSVDDNGPGIAVSERDRIFQPFFTTKGRGTGLGLALVQKIIVTHNGRITVAASSEGGASFQVALPIAPAPMTSQAC